MSKIFTQSKHVYIRDSTVDSSFSPLNRIDIINGDRSLISQSGNGLYANVALSNMIFQLKRVKADLDEQEYDKVRKSTNDFEDIGNSVFMNRAAVKMANMDAVFSLLWDPKLKADEEFIKNPQSLIFADLCGGPGGFSEYILWRCPNSKGYGFTLKNTTVDKYSSGINNDWHLTKFNQYCNINNFQIEYGNDGTGNILHLNNIEDLSKKTQQQVDIAVGDGGFDFDSGDVTRQEVEMYDLLTGQILMALRILKNGGSFLLKMFNTNTKYTVDLLELLSYVFENISIFKPVSSRPANAERYLICKNYTYNETIVKLLTDVLSQINLADKQKSNVKVISLLKETDPRLSAYLRLVNDEDQQIQLKYTARSIAVFVASGRINIDFKRTSNTTPIKNSVYREYDLTNFFKMWNIPASKK
jgi:cap1 methyltransferase